MKNVITVVGLVLSMAASSLTLGAEPADLGLTKVKDTRSRVAYLNLDHDFSNYDKIAIASIATDEVDVNLPRSSKAHRNDWEMDGERQARIDAMHQKAFDREFAESQNLELVDTVDDNTLVLATKLTEVAPTVGYDTQSLSSRSQVYSAGAGSATVEMYLMDGKTGEVVAVVSNARALGNSFVHRNNSVTNGSDVQMAFNSWARQARQAIDNLPELAANAG
jgi:hypothetical protein